LQDRWYEGCLSIEQVRKYVKELIANPVFEGFVAYKSSDIIIAVFLGHKRSWWNGREFFIDELFVAKKCKEKELEPN
jgi:aminoglycoside 6'-N-acetyltransferase I